MQTCSERFLGYTIASQRDFADHYLESGSSIVSNSSDVFLLHHSQYPGLRIDAYLMNENFVHKTHHGLVCICVVFRYMYYSESKFPVERNGMENGHQKPYFFKRESLSLISDDAFCKQLLLSLFFYAEIHNCLSFPL